MKVCFHYAVSQNLYLTFAVVFVKQIEKELFVKRGSEDDVFVVATVVYVVKAVCLEVAWCSGHGKRIPEGGEFRMKWGQT